MTGCIPQPLVQLFTSFLQFFFTVFLQFFFYSFLRFFTVFYKAVEWAGDFGAGDLGGLQYTLWGGWGGGGGVKICLHIVAAVCVFGPMS